MTTPNVNPEPYLATKQIPVAHINGKDYPRKPLTFDNGAAVWSAQRKYNIDEPETVTTFLRTFCTAFELPYEEVRAMEYDDVLVMITDFLVTPRKSE